MTTYDPKTVRPKDNWALILPEKRSETLASGIIIPFETGQEKVTELAAEVIRLGDGAFNDALRKQGLSEGSRIVYRGYLRWANPLGVDEKWDDGSPKQYCFVDSRDIMGIVEKDAKVGVLSGRPAVPHVHYKEDSHAPAGERAAHAHES